MSSIKPIHPTHSDQPAQPAHPDAKADIKAHIALAMTDAMATKGFAPMTDELDHALLIDDATRLEARALAGAMLSALPDPEDRGPYAMLTALGAMFSMVCADLGADQDTVFFQVTDTLLPRARADDHALIAEYGAYSWRSGPGPYCAWPSAGLTAYPA